MSRLVLEKNQFVFYDDRERIILLDLEDNMSNKGRIPLCRTEENGVSVLGLLVALCEVHQEVSEKGEEDAFVAFLTDILVASFLIRSSAPFKIVEIGAMSGVLSYHLATLAGTLNEKNSLCCVSNVIGNESENRWLDRICMVSTPPVLSMLVADYENTQLQSDYFDLVLINGEVNYEKPQEMLEEAGRLLKCGGDLICHVKDEPLLEDAFRKVFAQEGAYREYPVADGEKMLVASCKGKGIKRKADILTENVKEILDKLRSAAESETQQTGYRECVRQIDECVDMAVALWDTKKKDELLCLKETVMDYMLNMEDELAEYYKNELVRKIKYMLQMQKESK